MSNASKSLANDLVLASVKLTRHLRVADKQARMSGPQASALAVIVYAGRIRVSDLAAMEQVRSPTMVQMVNQLEAQGLAVREGDETDRRVSWVLDLLKEYTAEWEKLKAKGLKLKNESIPAFNKQLWELGMGAIW